MSSRRKSLTDPKPCSRAVARNASAMESVNMTLTQTSCLPASGELVGLDAWASAKVNAVLRRSLLMGAAHLELLARRVGR